MNIHTNIDVYRKIMYYLGLTKLNVSSWSIGFHFTGSGIDSLKLSQNSYRTPRGDSDMYEYFVRTFFPEYDFLDFLFKSSSKEGKKNCVFIFQCQHETSVTLCSLTT